MTAHIFRIDVKMHEFSEAERIWESGAGRLRALRIELGERLFALLDGPGRRLVRGLSDARAVDMPPHLVLRFRADATGGATSPWALRWRWETLHSPEGPLFGDRGIRAPRLTLQLGGAELGDATSLPTRCLRVLFMASSPLATEPVLDFENEEEQLLTAVAPCHRSRGSPEPCPSRASWSACACAPSTRAGSRPVPISARPRGFAFAGSRCR